MKTVFINAKGNIGDGLIVRDVADPSPPAEGEAIVRVRKRVVRAVDYQAASGLLPLNTFAQNGIPGIDGVGVVERVGAKVDPSTGISPGARVIIMRMNGSWAERVTVPATSLMPTPADIPDEIACQTVNNGTTALMLFRTAEQSVGYTPGAAPLLVSAANSSVARTLIGLATISGRPVIGLARRESDAKALASLFKDVRIIATDRPDWPAAVRSSSSVAPHVAIDPIGGEMMPALLDLLAHGGTLVVYGGLDPRPSQISSVRMTSNELTIRGTSSFGWAVRTSPSERLANFQLILEVARRMPKIFDGYREFPLTEAAEAVAFAQAGPRHGATIVTS